MFTNDNHKIVYDKGVGENKNWILSEDQLSVQRLAKCESIMCQGNGYMCFRGGLFEAPSEDVGPVTMIAGTFNHHEGDGCTMLINSANPLSTIAVINGERMGYDNIDYTTHTRSSETVFSKDRPSGQVRTAANISARKSALFPSRTAILQLRRLPSPQ